MQLEVKRWLELEAFGIVVRGCIEHIDAEAQSHREEGTD